MGQAIGQVLSFGVGVALSPIPIVAVVLMLATPRGRVNGPAFLGGWVVGLAAVGSIVLLVSSGADASTHEAPATWVSVLKLALGVLLLLVAAWQWRGRPARDEEAALPGWMQKVDQFTLRRSAGVAVALAAVNPKNLLLTVGAAAAIAQTGAGTVSQAVALAVFVAIATVGVGAPVAIYYLTGDRAASILFGLRLWMVRHNAAIMATLCLILGAKLIGDAISALTT